MNAEQKRAWVIVGLFALACVTFVVLGVLWDFRGAWGAFGLFGLGGFTFLLGRHERSDERDLAINRRATLAGAMASYGAFILGCMGTWFVAYGWHRQEQVSVHLLVGITWAGGMVFFTVRSLAILIFYGRHVEGEHA